MRRLGDVRTVLGEGPYWDVQHQVLWFVDIRGKMLWRYNPDGDVFDHWPTPIEPSAVTRTVDGRLVAALADGFYDFDPGTGDFTSIFKLDVDIGQVQTNDAKVDRQGRFITGDTAYAAGLKPVGSIRSFDGKAERILDSGYTICNGPCWSPDGTTFYIADTIPANKLYAYDYDTSTGAISNRREFADGGAIGGYADGATVDADGRLWMAFCGEGKIACFNPDGTVHRIVETDVKWVASVQFGGPDLDKLYVISFDPEPGGMSPDENSGYLYVIDDVGARGLAEPLAKI